MITRPLSLLASGSSYASVNAAADQAPSTTRIHGARCERSAQLVKFNRGRLFDEIREHVCDLISSLRRGVTDGATPRCPPPPAPAPLHQFRCECRDRSRRTRRVEVSLERLLNHETAEAIGRLPSGVVARYRVEKQPVNSSARHGFGRQSGSLGKNQQQPFFLPTLPLAPPTLDKERWNHGQNSEDCEAHRLIEPVTAMEDKTRERPRCPGSCCIALGSAPLAGPVQSAPPWHGRLPERIRCKPAHRRAF